MTRRCRSCLTYLFVFSSVFPTFCTRSVTNWAMLSSVMCEESIYWTCSLRLYLFSRIFIWLNFCLMSSFLFLLHYLLANMAVHFVLMKCTPQSKLLIRDTLACMWWNRDHRLTSSCNRASTRSSVIAERPRDALCH